MQYNVILCGSERVKVVLKFGIDFLCEFGLRVDIRYRVLSISARTVALC